MMLLLTDHMIDILIERDLHILQSGQFWMVQPR